MREHEYKLMKPNDNEDCSKKNSNSTQRQTLSTTLSLNCPWKTYLLFCHERLLDESIPKLHQR